MRSILQRDKFERFSALDYHRSHICTKYATWLLLRVWVRSLRFPPNHLQTYVEFADMNHVTVMNQKQNSTTLLFVSHVSCFTAPPAFESVPQSGLLSCNPYRQVSLDHLGLFWRHVYTRPYLVLQHRTQWVLVFDKCLWNLNKCQYLPSHLHGSSNCPIGDPAVT